MRAPISDSGSYVSTPHLQAHPSIVLTLEARLSLLQGALSSVRP